jgi:hypothetical protein
MSCVQEQPTGDPRSQLREKESAFDIGILLTTRRLVSDTHSYGLCAH